MKVGSGPIPSLLAPHLLHDEVVEERHHTDVEGLHPLLPEEAPEDLEAAQLEELLLGVGEVSQHGGQREESLVGREVRQHGGHSRCIWCGLSSWLPTGMGETHPKTFVQSSLADAFKPLLAEQEPPFLLIPSLPGAGRLPELG